MWKDVTSSNLNSLFKLFFYSPISTNNNLSLKIYCENIVVMLLNFDFLFLILFSFLSLVCFSSIHFFFFSIFLFFLLHTRTPTPHIYLHSLFDFLFFQLSPEHFSPSPSLFRSLSLTHTHTHTNFSPSISHKQIIFHTRIDHRQRTKIRVLPTSKNMQLNHHIGQIRVLFVFVFFFFFDQFYFIVQISLGL